MTIFYDGEIVETQTEQSSKLQHLAMRLSLAQELDFNVLRRTPQPIRWFTRKL